MAKRWVIGGLAVGVGALVMTPEARTWLRRRLGLEPEDRRWFEEEGVEAAEHEGDEPLDTREARYSLRARLAEEGLAESAEGAAPAAPEPPTFPAFPPAAAPSFPAFEQATPEPPAAAEAEPEPAAQEPAAHASFAWAPSAEPATDEPAAEEPAPEPEPEPEPAAPSAWDPAPASWAPAPAQQPEPSYDAPLPEPDPGHRSFEAVPALTPAADAPRTPGEDTNEIEPVTTADEHAEDTEDEAPPPPPTMLRPPTAPPPSRPFGESTSFRSAIDAARERVHGAAREATPDEGDGERVDKDDA